MMLMLIEIQRMRLTLVILEILLLATQIQMLKPVWRPLVFNRLLLLLTSGKLLLMTILRTSR